MQIEIDHVPYDLERVDPQTVRMTSDYFAEYLRIKTRSTEKHAGFHIGDVFVYLDVRGDVLEFHRHDGPLSADVVIDFFHYNLEAIRSIGYECLCRAPI